MNAPALVGLATVSDFVSTPAYSTDAASMYTSADLQNYSWLEPDWRGSDIDKEIAMWSPPQVSLLLENMPGGFVASNLRV